jgi:hypothetical protein
MRNADEATDPLQGVTVITEPTADLLNERQQIDFRNHREQCLEWLLGFGKNPKKADGYAHKTVKARAHRIDQFYRWIWQHETGGYTTNVTVVERAGGFEIFMSPRPPRDEHALLVGVVAREEHGRSCSRAMRTSSASAYVSIARGSCPRTSSPR